MIASDPLRILMVVEAPADARTVAALTDKVLQQSDRDQSPAAASLDGAREFVNLDQHAAPGSTPAHCTWLDVKRRGPRVLGHGRNGPTRHPYAEAARRAIKLAAVAKPKPTALILVIDIDSQPARVPGLREGREAEGAHEMTVVVGGADAKREAWILNLVDPKDQRCSTQLAQLKKQLELDPCKDAHRLRESQKGHQRNVKTVHAELVEDHEHELEILRQRNLEDIQRLGQQTGLAEFIAELAALPAAVAAAPK